MSDTAPSAARLTAAVLERLAAIVGREHALIDVDQQLPYLREWRDLYHGRAGVVLRPASTAQVADIMALANAHAIPVVPQAGNTGLVGGQIPFNGEILLSVARMRRVRELDAAGYSMTVEAGLTLAQAQAAAASVGRLFPLSLASEASCQIGGNLASNAGGVGVLAYGTARQLVLGLEVVLADGRVLPGLSALKKDNTGYDLKDLFIGSEGTLGIITAATLRLYPKPVEQATAFVVLPELACALALFAAAQAVAGASLTAFEFMPRRVLDVVLRHIKGARDPLPSAGAWYALIELSGLAADGGAQRLLEEILNGAQERGLIIDAAIANSLSQARAFWRLREAISEAQKFEGGSVKNDVSVPIAKIPEFIARADALVFGICPTARPLAFGHFGDGNVHYNILQPLGLPTADFLALWRPLQEAVHAAVRAFGGSISAEHGIGVMKREALAAVKSPLELELMRAIKAAFDPKGILNPGKVL
jgi:FAD/FMN-containing dehydrogenase